MKQNVNTTLIAKVLSGECSRSEKKEVEQWVESDPANKEIMEKMKKIWNASGGRDKGFGDHFNPEDDWDDFYDRVVKTDRDVSVLNFKKSHARGANNRFNQFLRVAAIIIFVSLAGFFAYQNMNYAEPEVAEPVLREISMDKGQRGNITLSDGTKVTLNADSKITLPNVFESDKREIRLKGEAFFDVAHNPDRPFIIKTDDAVVQVLGTSLDVRSYPDDESVQVVVKEGRVSFMSNKECADDDAILTAGERGQLFTSNNEILKTKVEDYDLFLGWMEGFLKFSDTPMHEVAGQLERKYDISINFRDESIKNMRLTAALKSRRIEYNIDVISTSLNVQYKMNQQSVTFYK